MRIIDVGCGPGIYVKALLEKGHDATGIDIDRNNPYDKVDIFSDHFLKYGYYDLCLCLEVAEHIGPRMSDELVKRLVYTAPIIIFSGAPPGQGGIGHINCQTKEFWEQKFNENNYVIDQIATEKFRNYMLNGYHMGWFLQNAMLYKKPNNH